ncbi:MAG: response regulator transcription factor [Planctomycetales bacterium]|nr:response regulator transcription factor [Planctomycetales bacterium]
MSIRVLVADDHEVVRSGLSSLLDDASIEIVGEASDGNQAVSMARELNPDVVLLDIRMSEGDGLTALEQLHSEMPEVKVVMLSTYDNPTYIARAVAMGASDYVLKGSDRDDLVVAIHNAASGAGPAPTSAMNRIAGAMNARKKPISDEMPLTNRESQVLRHVALGLSNKEIGLSLGISVETVKEHVQNILRKISVTDRTQAAVWAVRKGYV